MKKIVIIGAGYAGILSAKKLEKKLKKQDVSITIIDKNPFHTMLTELHEVAAARVDEDSIKISLKKVFAGRKVNVVTDTVEAVDFDAKTVKAKCASFEYDYLVMASGSKPTFFGVPGADEYSHTLWSYDDAVKLREHIADCFRKAAVEPDLEKKKLLLSFYTIGAGFTGVEMAGELAEYVPFLCEKHEIDRSLVTMFNVDVLTRACPVMPEKISAKVEKRLTKMGVNVMFGTGVVGIGSDYIELKRGEEVTRHTAGTVIWAAGIESSDIAKDAAKVLPSVGRGRIKTDEFLRSETNQQVFIAGDNMFFIPDGEKNPVPQMVENCEQCADIIAHNIAAAINGTKMEKYKPAFHGVMVCIGSRYGVAHVGMPKFMFSLASFFAMFAKHFINVVYFVQVAGWNKVFSYATHEFFTIRKNRSFLGGHFSNKTPSFLLMPLRVWLGMVWFFEGIKKIIEGWFGTPKLINFFGGAASWFNSVLASATDAVSSATAPVAEAVSSASGAVVEAVTSASGAVASASPGVAIINWNILGLFRMYLVSGKELALATISDYAFKLDIPLMNWFVNTLIVSTDGMQVFMQAFIVIMELLIGLALIGGLFTFPVTALSIFLQFMFVCTTGLYLSTFWMVFAAIALLIGGGRTLGMDYYAMPFLKKWWKNLPFIKKWYLYND